VARGRKLLLKEEVDAQDFREIKRENEKKIEMLEVRLIEASWVSGLSLVRFIPKNSFLTISVIKPQG
jgi:hypothetical protein